MKHIYKISFQIKIIYKVYFELKIEKDQNIKNLK